MRWVLFGDFREEYFLLDNERAVLSDLKDCDLLLEEDDNGVVVQVLDLNDGEFLREEADKLRLFQLIHREVISEL